MNMRAGAGIYLFLLTQICMLSDVKALTEYPDHNMIRYEYDVDDYNDIDTWEDARDFCVRKGLKLTTWAQLCPDGKGPFNSPVGGMINDSYGQFVAVKDDVERFVFANKWHPDCEGEGCVSCMGYAQRFNSNPWWETVTDFKMLYDYVFCYDEPTPKTIEEAVGTGCSNTIKISHSYHTIDGFSCDKCAFCSGSILNAIFNPDINSMCLDFKSHECRSLRIITSFNTPWVMKHISLSPSDMTIDTDPKSVALLGSNNLQDWSFIFESKLNFDSRSESEDFVFSHNTVSYKHYATIFVRKTSSSTMHVGHYGIVESYTKQCAANLHNDITGSNVLPYKEVV